MLLLLQPLLDGDPKCCICFLLLIVSSSSLLLFVLLTMFSTGIFRV